MGIQHFSVIVRTRQPLTGWSYWIDFRDPSTGIPVIWLWSEAEAGTYDRALADLRARFPGDLLVRRDPRSLRTWAEPRRVG